MGACGKASARPSGAKPVLGAKCVPCTSSSFLKSGRLCWVCISCPKVLTLNAAGQSASSSQASISFFFFFILMVEDGLLSCALVRMPGFAHGAHCTRP